MALCNPKQMLCKARAEGYAIGSFNIFNMESARAILAAAEAENAPVMLQVWSGFDPAPGLGMLGSIALAAAKTAAVPVAVHLDHGETLGQVGMAVAEGFTSVMLDASALPLEENIRKTRAVVQFCAQNGIATEGEIGHVGGGEYTGEADGDASAYTRPEEAARFYEETGVDFVAVSIGTAHGSYAKTPVLDIDLLHRIAARVPAPLVLHGSSYTPNEMLAAAVKGGIAKVNVATELSDAVVRTALSELPGMKDVRYANQLTDAPYAAMAALVRQKIRLFGGSGKAAGN